MPLAVRGGVIGALLAAKRDERHFTDDEIRLLQARRGARRPSPSTTPRSRELLAASNAALQQALLLDEQLTAVVLEGGDAAAILLRVRATTGVELVWVPAGDGDGADLLGARRRPRPAGPGGPARPRCPRRPRPRRGPSGHELVLERTAPVVALTVAEAQQAARASELGRDIAVIDLLTPP